MNTASFRLPFVLTLLATLVTVIGCAESKNTGSSNKDIATDLYRDGTADDTYLFYQRTTDIVATRCVEGLPPSRASCTEIVNEMDRTWFEEQLGGEIVLNYREITDGLAQLITEIDVMEDRLASAIVERNDLRAIKRGWDRDVEVSRGIISRDEPEISTLFSRLSEVEEQLFDDPENNRLLGRKETLTEQIVVLSDNIRSATETILAAETALAEVNPQYQTAENQVSLYSSNVSELRDDERNKRAQLEDLDRDHDLFLSIMEKIANPNLSYSILDANENYESLRPLVREMISIALEDN